MKKVVVMFAAAALTLPFVSCKENPKDPITETQEIQQEIPSEDLALATENDLDSKLVETYKYVTAPSGLSLREYNNLQSKKLGKMPYGTKVKILTPEVKQTMTVGGISGAMDEVEFNHKKGFAFNGYLSKYFPPERDITVNGYAEELQRQFPEVSYAKTAEGTASKPITVETITLPEANWHEAFFMAQQLFDFPKEFTFPSAKGKDFQVIQDNMPKKNVWTSQLEISRKDDALTNIAYVYTSQKLITTVTVEKEGTLMKISRKESMK